MNSRRLPAMWIRPGEPDQAPKAETAAAGLVRNCPRKKMFVALLQRRSPCPFPEPDVRLASSAIVPRRCDKSARYRSARGRTGQALEHPIVNRRGSLLARRYKEHAYWRGLEVPAANGRVG